MHQIVVQFDAFNINWKPVFRPDLKVLSKGSGCGSVGRAVAFDTRDPWFDSSRRQKMATLKKKIENTDELNYQNDRWQENVEEQLARKL